MFESKNRSVSGRQNRYLRVVMIAERLKAIAWDHVLEGLDAQGNAKLDRLLTAEECESLANLYAQDDHFRSTVVMQRHGFGRGEYRYFNYPLPGIVASLRTAVYSRLVPLANRWQEAMGISVRFPEEHKDYLQRCHEAGQNKATPLLLHYRTEDYNCLHQDLYGEQLFPIQLTILLSEPGKDFTGGEFVMTEQRPRMQSRPMVVSLQQGDAVLFAVRQRPVQGSRGVYRVNLRHGVSRIQSGERYALGIIFHDAQ